MLRFLDPRRDLFADGALHDPVTVSIAGLALGGISTIGGLIQGNKAQKTNDKLAADQAGQYQQVLNMANNMVSNVRKEEYDKLANQDSMNAIRQVSEIMASRGLGLGSSAMANAMNEQSSQIRSLYGRQYLSDRQGAMSTAMSAIAGVAGAPRLGYTQDPYAGFNSGIASMGQWAVNNRYGIGVNPVAPGGAKP